VTEKHGRVYWALEHFFQRLERAYRSSLSFALRRRGLVLLGALLAFLASVPVFNGLPRELAPQADEGRFLVGIRTPLGSSIEYTESKLREVEAIADRYPELVTEFGVIGLGQAQQVNQATLVARMKPRGERQRSQQQVIDSIRRDLSQIAGARAFPRAFGLVQGQRSEPLQFVVKGPNLQDMGRLAGELQAKLQADPQIGRMDTDLQLDLPQLVLEPDRVRAAGLNLNSADIAAAVNMLTGGVDIAKYNDYPGDGERYDIRVKAKEGEFTQQADLSKIYLRSRTGQLVRLDSVARFREALGPAVIGRFDLQYSATFFATPTVSLGEAIEKVRAAARDLPIGYRVVFVGEAEQLEKTSTATAFTFMLALILLFMVLASQFNSFLQPIYIMLAVPLGIVGGIAALWLSGYSLNIYSGIGLVLLIGLVAKNSILLVDLTNQRREQGMSIDDALRDACPIRMRPVVMTSLTIILALAPAAIGLGAGAETNAPLSIAVIGGMITSTLLTLVVVPAGYSVVENWREHRRAARTAGAAVLKSPQSPRDES
jgi:HAE1 family hydrophobic/amphiphilic exporter-1